VSRALFLAIALTATAAEPIRLHPKNPHYFEFRGKPVALVTSAEHYGSVLNAKFDYRRYLDTLAAAGLNYTRIFGGAYVEVPGRSFGIKRNTLAPDPADFLAPWPRDASGKFDFDRWNDAYFARLRDFLVEAGKRNIVVEITPFCSTYGEAQWNISPFHQTGLTEWKKLHTLENGPALAIQERYARKLAREAGAFDNVFFEIQNEPWSDRPILSAVVNNYLGLPARDRYPNSIDVADALSTAWQSRVAGWIAAEAPHALIAQNYANFAAPVRDLAEGVSIVNFHYAYPVAVEANYGLGKVIGYDETGFLGQSDAVYLRQAWNFLLSGGGLFNNLDYSFSVGHEDGGDPEQNGPGGGSVAFRRQLGVLSRFLHSFDLATLTRDTNVVAHAGGVYARALSTPAGAYAIYLDGDGPTTLTLHLPAGNYTGVFLDPRTGAEAAIPAFRPVGGVHRLDTPAFKDGIAIRLARATGR
jgi:hypothetical protein